MNQPRDPHEPKDLGETLSALLDGELSRSESAFLLKRLEHDAGLRLRWERYRDIGDVMRGQASALQGRDFAASVMARIQNESPAPIAAPAKLAWQRLLAGAAIAATVAAVALQFPLRSPVLTQPQLAAGTVAQPTLLLSPLVDTHKVAAQRGAMPTLLVPESNSLPFDEYLRMHTQAAGGRAALAPYVYVVGERDQKYLPQ